jgi:hypothetical protein
MRETLRALRWLAICATVMVVAAHANAQATRTWVSGVGDDANPCSRTAPCKTFAGAISKTAPNGEISVLDPGGYGAVTITKAITINGEGTLASTLVSFTNGIVVSAGATDVVTLRNIEIVGVGNGLNGIRFLAGGALNLEKVSIYGFTGQCVDVETGVGTALVFITDSHFHDCAGGAVLLAPNPGNVNATLDRVTMFRNQRGVRAQDGVNVNIVNSVAANNSGNGFIASGTTRAVDMTLESTSAVQNTAAGVFSGPLATVRISHTNVSQNGTGLSLSGGTINSSGNNTVQGNGTNGAPSLSPGQI